MTRSDKDWEMLNAYVDGELDHRDTASVARSIAGDAGLASAAASLAHLKSALLDQQEPASDDLIPLSPEHPKRNRPSRRLVYLAGAATIVLCLAIAALYPQIRGSSDESGTLWVRQAVDLHSDWAVASAEDPPSSLALPAIGGLTSGEVRIPDLSDSGLTPIHLSPLRLDGGLEGYRIGYGGSRGCRVSLFVLQGAGAISEQPLPRAGERQQASVWQHGTARYLLLAQGMAEPRFELIARVLEAMTANWKPLSRDLRTALRNNRQASTPCLA